MPSKNQSSSNSQLLQAFLEAGSKVFLSGEALASHLHISRVAVHSRIKKLELSGISFEAIPRKGYRLVREPEELHSDLLGAYLSRDSISLHSIRVLSSIDSTNLEVDRMLANDCPAPLAVIAHHQSRGRGRLGRVWHSESSGNLYLSLGFRPEVSTSGMSPFSLWAGVRIAQCLRELLGIPVEVKWPNDLHVEGRKIAGILCEAKLELDRVQTLVFGFGLNVNQDASSLPEDLRTPANSLKSILGEMAPIHPITVGVIKSVLNAFADSSKQESGLTLQSAFKPLDALYGKVVQVQSGLETISGVAYGIDVLGNLLLETEKGKMKPISAGDVSVIPSS